MGSAIADLIPLSIGIAVNPIPIIVVVLILDSPQGRANSLIFLGSWVLGLAALAGIVLATTSAAESSSYDGVKTVESVIRILLGLLLLSLATKKWGKRPKPGEEVELPKWMASIETLGPGKTLGVGLLITIVNPKHVALTVAAMISIAQAHLAPGTAVALLAIFVLLSSLGVGTPVIYALAGGESAKTTLATWKAWLSANNAAILAVLFLVFGVVLLSKGIGDLLG